MFVLDSDCGNFEDLTRWSKRVAFPAVLVVPYGQSHSFKDQSFLATYYPVVDYVSEVPFFPSVNRLLFNR